jgi:hypothetical protein
VKNRSRVLQGSAGLELPTWLAPVGHIRQWRRIREVPAGHRPVRISTSRTPSPRGKAGNPCRTARNTMTTPFQDALGEGTHCIAGVRDKATGGTGAHTNARTSRCAPRIGRTARPRGTLAARRWTGTRAREWCPHRRSPQDTPPSLPAGRGGRTSPPSLRREAPERRRSAGQREAGCSSHPLDARRWECRCALAVHHLGWHA